MANVTYYLGAGASANALPTYATFTEEFEIFCRRILNHPKEEISREHIDHHGVLSFYIPKILENLPFHLTPDTLAKQYFHQNSDNLNALKALLTIFLLNRQWERFDKRYTAFIAALLEPREKSCRFYPALNILSWNYDIQFELAFQRFSEKSMEGVLRELNVFPYLELDEIPYSRIEQQFKLIHLNGFAYSDSHLNPSKHTSLLTPPIEEIFQFYAESFMNKNGKKLPASHLLRFAWEPKPSLQGHLTNSSLDIALKIAAETEVLVVIGYSFPIFNNEVDKLIFSKMARLEKVYIQNPSSEIFEKAKDNLFNKILSPARIFHVTQKDAFFLPNELSPY